VETERPELEELELEPAFEVEAEFEPPPPLEPWLVRAAAS
jgi:hypothetical protein